MSFGFSVCGNPANVQKNVELAFDKAAENCKAVPHEAESITIAKQIALKQLEFYATLKQVNQGAPGLIVNCSGHASLYGSGEARHGDSTFTLEIKPLYGFVE